MPGQRSISHEHQTLSMPLSLGGQKWNRSFTENGNCSCKRLSTTDSTGAGLPNSLGSPHHKEMVPKPTTSKFPVDQCDSTNHCPRFSLVTLKALNGNKIWTKAQGILQPPQWAP